MSFSLYAHRLTDLLISAFTFTFSPSQAFSSFYLIYIFSTRTKEIYVYCATQTPLQTSHSYHLYHLEQQIQQYRSIYE
uniref:Uncharacterized protein n=1 Tax=Siphoviridae sp. ct1IF5 TaxID=2827765 RepID=A0A8S5TFC3_9CAUD|nr:MAG TPA: hypothetical protein [Siphoviridae sp. ct1IF5]DAJ72845.1 MAG TPA: hypothetical protein [Caudoviricetes sp.]